MNPNDLIDFGAGDTLLEALCEVGVISESAVSKSRSIASLLESVSGTTTKYFYKGREIPWDVFKLVYTNYDMYQERSDILTALGFTAEEFEPTAKAKKQKPEDNRRTVLNRITNHFMDNNSEARKILVPFSDRKTAYSKHFSRRKDADDEFDPYAEKPTTDEAIRPGEKNRRNRSTAIIDRINSQDLMPGEFYSNFTRIPKTRWGSWFRMWEREVSSVKNDRSRWGRPWMKHFVLGYQLSPKLVYEIWYNSIDSTFTIHDWRGNHTMNRKFPSLSEAIKAIFTASAQSSSRDSEVFNSMNNQLAQSIGRSMVQGLDSFLDDVQKMEVDEQERNKRLIKAAEERRSKEIQDELEAKAALRAIREKNVKAGKEMLKKAGAATVNYATGSGRESAIAFGNATADAALKAYTAGSINAEAMAKRVAQVFSTANSKEGRNIFMAMVEGDIDITDYVLGIRTLESRQKAAEEKAERDEETARKRREDVTRRAKEYAESRKQGVIRLPHLTESTEYSLEYLIENHEGFEAQEDYVDSVTDTSKYSASINQIRKEASGKVTQDIVKGSVNSELISVYDETRVTQSEFRKNSVRWLNSGRKEPIVLPTDKQPTWNRLKMFMSGQRYQADFVVGFSLVNTVNIEVWYVTEPNPQHKLVDFSGKKLTTPTIGSFYVFDISSGTLLRKYIPYYRNAVQIAMAKISAI